MGFSSSDTTKLFPRENSVYNIPFFGVSAMGNYQHLDKLGEGTFGTVSKCKMTEFDDRGSPKGKGKLVALKKINIHDQKIGFPITAFREITILKRLKHKNILPLLDVVANKEEKFSEMSKICGIKHQYCSFFLVSPYMKSDLSGLLHNPDIEFDVPSIKCLMYQLLEGLDYLHKQGYYHRDIKTANLLVDHNNVLKIADFGLARKYYGHAPRSQGGPSEVRASYTPLVVTRWYRAPELLLGDSRYTTAIDMWGVGCIFAEFFEHTPILKGKSDLDQLYKIFKLIGEPTEQNYPEFVKLKNPMKAEITHYNPTLRSRFGQYFQHSDSDHEQGIDLLQKLLCINPMNRLNAEQALKHQYFSTSPYAHKPSDLPEFEASHEMDNKKFNEEKDRRERAKATQQQGFSDKYPNENGYGRYHNNTSNHGSLHQSRGGYGSNMSRTNMNKSIHKGNESEERGFKDDQNEGQNERKQSNWSRNPNKQEHPKESFKPSAAMSNLPKKPTVPLQSVALFASKSRALKPSQPSSRLPPKTPAALMASKLQKPTDQLISISKDPVHIKEKLVHGKSKPTTASKTEINKHALQGHEQPSNSHSTLKPKTPQKSLKPKSPLENKRSSPPSIHRQIPRKSEEKQSNGCAHEAPSVNSSETQGDKITTPKMDIDSEEDETKFDSLFGEDSTKDESAHLEKNGVDMIANGDDNDSNNKDPSLEREDKESTSGIKRLSEKSTELLAEKMSTTPLKEKADKLDSKKVKDEASVKPLILKSKRSFPSVPLSSTSKLSTSEDTTISKTSQTSQSKLTGKTASRQLKEVNKIIAASPVHKKLGTASSSSDDKKKTLSRRSLKARSSSFHDDYLSDIEEPDWRSYVENQYSRLQGAKRRSTSSEMVTKPGEKKRKTN
ncbi:cyclin-dependent serine/threonine protein kinase [Saccharomycopsis crataegensis]|uniref:Serine/threonine-protein kinase BUR1 n=1 Tax=Saccharomycopsis crataegensis TaxID=43959 RepID=A0AAV5QS38_9ASCO|nr:cyclin-dependent serine/threonine protein kinase [Saccharomycopsis crataegensis]